MEIVFPNILCIVYGCVYTCVDAFIYILRAHIIMYIYYIHLCTQYPAKKLNINIC